MAIAARPAGWIAERRAVAVPSTRELPSIRVILALARREGPRMLKHPSYLVILPLGILLTGVRSLDEVSTDMLGPLVILLVIGIFVGTLITANLAAIRARRDGTDELYGSMPSSAVARTSGQLMGLVVGPAGVTFVLTLAALAFRLAAPDASMWEDIEVGMFPQFPLAVVAIGTLAIAVGRWVPSIFGAVSLIALHVFTGFLWAVPWVIWDVDASGHLWHLVYLVSVILGFGALAILRDRRGPALIAATVLGIGLAAVAAVEQVPPGGY